MRCTTVLARLDLTHFCRHKSTSIGVDLASRYRSSVTGSNWRHSGHRRSNWTHPQSAITCPMVGLGGHQLMIASNLPVGWSTIIKRDYRRIKFVDHTHLSPQFFSTHKNTHGVLEKELKIKLIRSDCHTVTPINVSTGRLFLIHITLCGRRTICELKQITNGDAKVSA